MLLDGIMVHRDQYLIYCSTLNRWALLLWEKVCVLKGRKANIHFIRKQENWMQGIKKSIITVFALLQVKSSGFKSIHRHDGVDLLCLTVTVYPCLHSSHSFPLFHSLSLSLNGSSSFFSMLRYLCIDGFRTASQVNSVLLHIDRKNNRELNYNCRCNQMQLPFVRAEVGAKTDLQFLFWRHSPQLE